MPCVTRDGAFQPYVGNSTEAHCVNMKLELLDRTDLAVQTIRYLARSERAPARVIAEDLGTSPGFLTQVLRPLVEHRVLASTRGPSGGYELANPNDEISMLRVIEAIEGPTDNGHCVLRDAVCHAADKCSIHDAWALARRALLETLETTPVINDISQEAHQ